METQATQMRLEFAMKYIYLTKGCSASAPRRARDTGMLAAVARGEDGKIDADLDGG